MANPEIAYKRSPAISNDSLNHLFGAAWPHHQAGHDFSAVLSHSLVYICAIHQERLVGFVNVAWDGGIHAFLLDTTVHPHYQRQGIGTQLVQQAIAAAQQKGMRWLHVDYEAHLAAFYQGCGFFPTRAGLYRLQGHG